MVSGESSTTSTVSWGGLAVIPGLQPFDFRIETSEIIGLRDLAHPRHEGPAGGRAALDLIQLGLYTPYMANLAQMPQLFDMACCRRYDDGAFCASGRRANGLMTPFQFQKPSDGIQQRCNVDGFDQIAVMHAIRRRGEMRLIEVRRNDDDYRSLDPHAPQPACNLPSVHARHPYIQQNQVRLAIPRQGDACGAIRDIQYRKAERRQNLMHDFPVYGVIIGDNHGSARPVISGNAHLPCAGGARTHDLRQHQPDTEDAAFARRAGNADVTPHGLRQNPCNRQPKTRSRRECGVHWRMRRALKGLKNLAHILGVNANARILDLEYRHLVAIAHTQRDLSLSGEFDGVGEKIDQHLAQPVFVGINSGRHIARHLVMKCDTFLFCLKTEHIHKLIKKIHDAHFLTVKLETSRFNLGNVEKTVDQNRKMFCASPHDADGACTMRGNLPVAFQ